MPQPRALLLGTGVAVPPIRVDNHMLSRIVDTTDDWIQERSGIVTRYYVEPGVGLGGPRRRGGAVGARRRRRRSGRGRLPGLRDDDARPLLPGRRARSIQQQLGIRPIPALDIRQQCAGFAYGLQVVDALIRSGIARTVLLVGCDVHTSLMPFSPRTWEVLYGEEEDALTPEELAWNSQFRHLLVLFGDGAGAMVFRAHEVDDGRGILGARLYGEGGEKDILHVPGVGSKRRPYVSHEIVDSAAAVPVMDGRAVFKHAVSRMPEVTRAVLADHGYGLADLDLLVMHQANLRINEAARKALDLPEAKVHNNIQKYGNTTSATLPLAFHEAQAEGKAPEGALVALTALGAGLHWGSVLMRV